MVSYRTKLPHHLCFRQWLIRTLLGLPLLLCSLKLMICEIAVLLKRSKTYSDLTNLLNDSTFMTAAGNSLCTKSTKSTKPSQLHPISTKTISQSIVKKGDMARSTVRLASGFWSVCVAKSSKTGCPPTMFACLAKAVLRFHGISTRPMESGSHPLSQWIQSPTRSCEDWACSQHGCAMWQESMRCRTESALKLIISAYSDLKESPAQPHSPQKLVPLWGGFYPHLLPNPDFGLRIATDCTHACKALQGWLNFDKPHPRKGVNLCLGRTTVDDCWMVLL